MGDYKILRGDVLARLAELPDNSVHCVVTSPPYWGLRDYGCEGQIGLEATPAEFLAKMVAVFAEVRRVLREDGTCWVNMGDSYANDTKWGGSTVGKHVAALHGDSGVGRGRTRTGLKSKDLVGMPWRLAFALQADGWWLRQDIIWAKPNPMPESVTDRCTKAHEYVFLLTKSARYYYDADAIRTPFSPETKALSFATMEFARRDGHATPSAKGSTFTSGKTAATKPTVGQGERADSPMGANKRSVWIIPTEAFPEAHFATFPQKLVEPCILAGTSKMGCCEICGAPWEREVSTTLVPGPKAAKTFVVDTRDAGADRQDQGSNRQKDGHKPGWLNESVTTGWSPTCTCIPITTPCTVLDPFSGSGTTGLVALAHRCHFIGIELNPEYAAMSERRLSAATSQGVLACA